MGEKRFAQFVLASSLRNPECKPARPIHAQRIIQFSREMTVPLTTNNGVNHAAVVNQLELTKIVAPSRPTSDSQFIADGAGQRLTDRFTVDREFQKYTIGDIGLP